MEKQLIEKLRELKTSVSNYFALKADMEAGRAYPKESVQNIMDYEEAKINKLLPDFESEIASLEQIEAEKGKEIPDPVICPKCNEYSWDCECKSTPADHLPETRKEIPAGAEATLRKHFTCLDDVLSETGISWILHAMEEHTEQRCDAIYKLFNRPYEKLKPLKELYRKEHPDPEGKYYIPDMTKFYEWIAIKVKEAMQKEPK